MEPPQQEKLPEEDCVRRPKIAWDKALWMDLLIERVFEGGFNYEKNEVLVKFLESAFGLRIPATAFKNRLQSKAHKNRIRKLSSESDLENKLQRDVYNLQSFPEIIEWLSQRSHIDTLRTSSKATKLFQKPSSTSLVPVTEETLRKYTSKVLVVYCGGTFGMTGKPLHPNTLENLISLAEDEVPVFSRMFSDTGSCVPVSIDPIDSSSATPNDWYEIAEKVVDKLIDHTKPFPYQYRGAVIIHGTDTMAYTASALHYLMSHIPVPIVMTGSQKPLLARSSDALNNFLGAVEVALYDDVESGVEIYAPGVTLFFNRRLMLGGCLMKLDSLNYNAFDSPRQSYLAVQNAIGLNIAHSLRDSMVQHVEGRSFKLFPKPSSSVVLVRLFPGLNEQFLINVAESAKGIILLAYGTGNGPPWMLPVLKNIIQRNLIVAINTECMKGGVGKEYAASLIGQLKQDEEVHDRFINCAYLTSEASFTKLSVIIGKIGDPDVLTKELQSKVIAEWQSFKQNGLDPSGADNAIEIEASVPVV